MALILSPSSTIWLNILFPKNQINGLHSKFSLIIQFFSMVLSIIALFCVSWQQVTMASTLLSRLSFLLGRSIPVISFSLISLPMSLLFLLLFIYRSIMPQLTFSSSPFPFCVNTFSLNILNTTFISPSPLALLSHTVTSFLLAVLNVWPPPPPPGIYWSCSMVFCLLVANAILRALWPPMVPAPLPGPTPAPDPCP